MNVVSHVQRAIECAPVIRNYSGSTNELADYKFRGDDYPFQFAPSTLPPEPNEIVVAMDGPIRLTHLFRAYGDVTGYRPDRELIEQNEQHERQHGDAARFLGATNLQLGVRFLRQEVSFRPRSTLLIQPFMRVQDFNTTKLGMALILAHPLELSEGDYTDIAAVGYENVEQLAYLAVARNQRRAKTETSYPVPLSFL